MKTLKKKLQMLNNQHDDISKINKFIVSKKGIKMVNMLNKNHIEALEKRFEAPVLSTKDAVTKYKLYFIAATKKRLIVSPKGIVDYTGLITRAKKNGTLKLPKNLTKQELFDIQNPLIRDINGNPIQKTTRRGLRLWNARTNMPIYRRKSKSIRLETASKCHLYEIHKMEKWDRRNPYPTPKQLCFELFPEEVIAAHNTRRNLALETIRNELAEKYCNVDRKYPLLRLYSTHKTIGYGGKEIIYEKECDPYIVGYPFTSYNSFPKLCEIRTKLQKIATNITDKSIVALKVYDKYGNLRDSIRNFMPYYTAMPTLMSD